MSLSSLVALDASFWQTRRCEVFSNGGRQTAQLCDRPCRAWVRSRPGAAAFFRISPTGSSNCHYRTSSQRTMGGLISYLAKSALTHTNPNRCTKISHYKVNTCLGGPLTCSYRLVFVQLPAT